MKRIVVAAWVLTGLAACDDPTRPADPPAMSPAPGVAALQFGRIRITAPTTGPIRAGHRYEVIVCASRGFICPWEPILRRPLAPNDTLITPRYGSGPVEFSVELKNIPARCRVRTANPTPFFIIPANSIREVRFRVVCG